MLTERTATWSSDTPVPAIIHTSSEARVTGLTTLNEMKLYERLSLGGHHSTTTYINWEVDTIVMITYDLVRLAYHNFFAEKDYPPSPFVNSCQRLAMISRDVEPDLGKVVALLPKLQELVLIPKTGPVEYDRHNIYWGWGRLSLGPCSEETVLEQGDWIPDTILELTKVKSRHKGLHIPSVLEAIRTNVRSISMKERKESNERNEREEREKKQETAMPVPASTPPTSAVSSDTQSQAMEQVVEVIRQGELKNRKFLPIRCREHMTVGMWGNGRPVGR